jgi:hypothetical protein
MRGSGKEAVTRPALRFALAVWVLLLALLPYLHQPLVHPALADDLAWAICTTDGDHVPSAPSHGGTETCPVFDLLQVFGTQLAPPVSVPPLLVRLAMVDRDPPLSFLLPALAATHRPLQPRAPPSA